MGRLVPQKRKRRTSDDQFNIENKPVHDEKKSREDSTVSSDDGNERQPLSHIPVLQVSLHSSGEMHGELNILSSPESQSEKSPSTDIPSSSSSIPVVQNVVSPDSSLVKTLRKSIFKRFKHSPWESILPKVDWVNVSDWWMSYMISDAESHLLRSPNAFCNHPGLQPRMRSVLLEWLIEVCDVFQLHRETYYLTVDYLDRYLHHAHNISKAKLQLIGISCLLIASKIEEIYPPKVAEYAFVTDGACSENDILNMELSIMKILNWKLKTITVNCWLLIYLQMGYMIVRRERTLDCIHSYYPIDLYVITAQLLDLATLDVRSLNFKYSILAVSALYIVCCGKFPVQVTGYQLPDFKECVNWMESFWNVLYEKNVEHHKYSCNSGFLPVPNAKPVSDMAHFRQQHNIDLELLESAQNSVGVNSKSISLINMITPPSSSEKLLSNE